MGEVRRQKQIKRNKHIRNDGHQTTIGGGEPFHGTCSPRSGQEAIQLCPKKWEKNDSCVERKGEKEEWWQMKRVVSDFVFKKIFLPKS